MMNLSTQFTAAIYNDLEWQPDEGLKVLREWLSIVRAAVINADLRKSRVEDLHLLYTLLERLTDAAVYIGRSEFEMLIQTEPDFENLALRTFGARARLAKRGRV